jgi:hypothetical protein
VLVLVATLATSCREEDACKPTPGEVTLASSPDSTSEYALVAGSTNERVGTIRITSDGTSLHVFYELLPGFDLSGVHVCAQASSFSWISPGSCPWAAENLPPGTTQYELVIPLQDLTSAPCGAVISLEAHAEVRASASDAGTVQSAYAGSFRGFVEYVVSCAEPPAPSPSPSSSSSSPVPAPPPSPPPPEPSGPACRLTQGFWKNHPESWPVRALDIGAVRYEQAELLEILRTPTGGDASLILGHQLIATELNVATGSAEPAALAGARAWMTANADADARLPYGVFEGHSAYASGVDLAAALDAYNNGER